jgi:hypothetical protein
MMNTHNNIHTQTKAYSPYARALSALRGSAAALPPSVVARIDTALATHASVEQHMTVHYLKRVCTAEKAGIEPDAMPDANDAALLRKVLRFNLDAHTERRRRAVVRTIAIAADAARRSRHCAGSV